MVLRLLRFLPRQMKEKWLFELLTLMRVSPKSVTLIVANNEWQPYIFTLVSEILDEVKEFKQDEPSPSPQKEAQASPTITRQNTSPALAPVLAAVKQTDTAAGERDSFADSDAEAEAEGEMLRTWSAEDMSNTAPAPAQSFSPPKSDDFASSSMRFDLAMKLYSMLLAHSVREGGDHAFQALETAASLQRMCVNGHEVFSTLFSHIMADLTDNGTVVNAEDMVESIESPIKTTQRNKALKQSASIVTAAASR